LRGKMKYSRNDKEYYDMARQNRMVSTESKKTDIEQMSDEPGPNKVKIKCPGSKLKNFRGRLYYDDCRNEGWISKDARVFRCPKCNRTYWR